MLEVIEESLFRNPDAKAEAFNLEAYRELLMLNSIAKYIISEESVVQEPVKTFDRPNGLAENGYSQPMTLLSMAIQPLSAKAELNHQVNDGSNTVSLMASVIPPVSIRLGLNIDLEQLNCAAYSAVSLPVVTDLKYFGNVQTAASNASAALPVFNLALLSSATIPASTDNLIDFAVFDEPPAASKKPQPPKF